MPSRSRDRLVFAAWIAWAAFLLAHYFVQVLLAVRARRLPSHPELIGAAVVPLLVALVTVFTSVCSSGAQRIARAMARRLPPRAPGIVLVVAGLLTVPWFLARHQIGAALLGLSAVGFPSLGEAVARGSAALIGSVLVVGAALGFGSMVLRWIGWHTSSRVEHLVFAAVTGLGVVSYASLLLATTGIYHPLAVATLIGALLAAGALHAPRLAARPWEPTARERMDLWTSVWLALIAVALGYALTGALAPEKEYDALWYHLRLPRLWMDAGRPVDVIEDYVSLYPLTWELVFGAGMALGGPVAAKLLHFACLPLLALLVAQAARRFMPGVSPVAAAAIVVTTPTLLWESTTAYVDLALALHAAAACYALARYSTNEERPWGIVAAVQFGLAAATKHLGVFVTIIALGLYVLGRQRQGIMRRVTPAMLMALLAAAVPFPWYLRAWVQSGNPVFPELFGVFGASPPERWNAMTEQGLAQFKAHFGMGRSPLSLLALPWNMTVHGARFSGSLGPLFLLLLPVLLLARQRAAAVRWLTWGTVAYVVLWASPVSSFQMRFVMPIVAPMALMAAAALHQASLLESKALRRGHGVVSAGVMCLALVNLPPFTPFHEADRVGFSGWLTHVLREPPVGVVAGREPRARYLRREVPSFPAWQWINTHLPADARILAFSGGDQLYTARNRISHEATIARTAVWGVADQRVDATMGALQRLGITHVLFDRRELVRLRPDAPALASPTFQHACIVPYDDGRYWVCELGEGEIRQQNR